MSDQNDSTTTTPAPAAPETFSKDYVRELREENKGWRLKAQEHETAAKSAQEALARAQVEAAEKISAAEQRANDRTIRAELRTAAIKAGMVDLDGLKMLDLSSVKLADDGSVEGADALIEAAKKAKPFLFGNTVNTSNPNPPPPAKAPAAKSAREMDDKELEAAIRNRTWRN
jgi:cell division septum initiation protein DivIVA